METLQNDSESQLRPGFCKVGTEAYDYIDFLFREEPRPSENLCMISQGHQLVEFLLIPDLKLTILRSPKPEEGILVLDSTHARQVTMDLVWEILGGDGIDSLVDQFGNIDVEGV